MLFPFGFRDLRSETRVTLRRLLTSGGLTHPARPGTELESGFFHQWSESINKVQFIRAQENMTKIDETRGPIS